MILHNGDVLFGWPLQSHVITAGWFYNDFVIVAFLFLIIM